MGQADQDALKARIAHYYSDLGWLYRRRRERAKSVGAYLKAWQWSSAGAHLVHAAKACWLRGRHDNRRPPTAPTTAARTFAKHDQHE
jgi:hypothetical protein